ATGLSFTRTWLRCNASGTGCAPLPGASAASYLLERDDFGSTLRVRVTADDGSTQVSADSAATPVITAPNCPVPITLALKPAGAMTQSPSSVAWNNPTQAAADDGQVATAAAMLPGSRSDALLIKGFGFSVPKWAQMTGVKVDIKRSATGGAVKDLQVQIVGPGQSTSNLALGATWPSAPGVVSYAGPTTNFLNGWPAASINDSEFGVRLIATNTGSALATANVDSVQITLYYTSGPAVGPNSPSTLADDTTVGNVSWTNHANASALDGVTADSPVLSGSQATYGLAATGYGFSLPPGKQPSGVYVEVTRKGSGSFASFIQDSGITLMKAGVPLGAGINTGDSWPSAFATKSYGGATSKFGTTLNAADVAHAGFGFRFVARNSTTSLSVGPANVDAVLMWVVYDAAPTNSPKFATTASTSVLGKSWTNVANAAVVDGNTASVSLSGQSVSDSLRSANHGLSVPADAWVRGLALQVDRRSLSGIGIEDSMVTLRLGGQSLPSNHALAGIWSTSVAPISYGGANDLWGQSVVDPSDVNAPSFGSEFVAKYAVTSGNDMAHVDGVSVAATYCAHP
nr:hypothetical protein [Polyangiaceae bacterium]